MHPVDHSHNHTHIHHHHTTMILVGGWLMVLFSILFVGVTLAIDNLAQSQTMLYGLESHNLFKVAAGSGAIRFLLTIYGLLPLLLIPGAVATYYTFRHLHAANMRVGMYFATTGVIALAFSLLMLPSLNWHLVTYINALPVADQPSMIVMLQAIHTYFGVFIGDLLGIGSLLVWFFITSFVMMRDPAMPRPVGIIQLIIALLATLALALRYSAVMPETYVNMQVPGLVALWIFICGISLISLRR